MRSIRAILGDRETIVVARSASIADAARLMSAHHIGALPVLDDDRLVGIFTERDVLTRIVAESVEREDALAQVGEAQGQRIDAGKFLDQRDGDVFGIGPLHG